MQLLKKELVTHFTFMLAFFLLISVANGMFEFRHIVFWFGGIFGTLLPDVDHFIYAKFLKPNEESAVSATEMSKKSFIAAYEYLIKRNVDNAKLVFHNANFQLIFFVFAFLVVTSSGNLLGIGLVLAFLVHLIVDELIDFFERNRLSNWFVGFLLKLDSRQEKWFLGFNIVGVFLLGFML